MAVMVLVYSLVVGNAGFIPSSAIFGAKVAKLEYDLEPPLLNKGGRVGASSAFDTPKPYSFCMQQRFRV